MPFPAPAHAFPTKDEMADYLETYAAHFKLPVWTGVRVDRLSKQGERFIVTADEQRFEVENVVVAMANWQQPRLPSFATEIDPSMVQIHSSEYRNLSQLQDGDVLIVGSGNSGAEIALETARGGHRTWISGRDPGQVPFHIDGLAARLILIHLVLGIVFHRVMTVNTPIGRKARSKSLSHAMPLLRVKSKHLAAAGVERVPRTVGVQDGLPMMEGGRVLKAANIIWCMGFHPGFSWIDLPVLGEEEPLHERGVVASEPGLYFVGLHFLYAASSAMVQGASRDAEYVANHIAARSTAGAAAGLARSLPSSEPRHA
jgi:putative flavoprotein involved in K+ transport